MVAKRVQFDDETWLAIMTVAGGPRPFSSSDEPLGIFGDVMVSRSSA